MSRDQSTDGLLTYYARLAAPLLICLAALAINGCATRVWNHPISDKTMDSRYEFRNNLPSNSEEIFVVLAFSGGGTRAASFSYGVLQTLRDTGIIIDGKQRRLLDEVDVITSVSGGSYTAAYYGLFGERIFSDFTRDFLYRDWQGELLGLALRPRGLAAIASDDFNRSDLVADYLDSTLFQHRTFADMSVGDLPFVIINASDLNNSITFSFIQQQFDFLCSDISTYPVAHAVMASSALPGPFATMALRNHEGCSERRHPWVDEALAGDDYLERRRMVANALKRYADPTRMPILRLVDGGVTDNLGVRGSMMSPVAHYGNVPDMAGAFTPEQLERVRSVLVVVANAEAQTVPDWSVSGREPGLVEMLQSSFNASLGLLNTETVGLARQGFLMWGDQVNAKRAPGSPQVRVHFAVLTFNQIADAGTRDRLNAMPTTFRLNQDQVDTLIIESRNLLEQSEEFKAFIQRVQQTRARQ